MSRRPLRLTSPRLGLLCFIVTHAVLLSGWPSTVNATSIWREGEHADSTSVRRHNWYDGVQRELLSGGDWLSNFGPEEGKAVFRVKVPAAGEYTLWVRANPVAAAMDWKLNRDRWREVPLQHAKHQVNVARDGAIDLRFVAWVRLGTRQLEVGRHTLQFRMRSENNNHGAIDAIFLTDEGLEPVGKGNPQVEGKKHAPGFFAWSPGRDPLEGNSPIDLRRLNESVAGADGFVRRRGDQFLLGSGKPVRFWAVQDGLGTNPAEYQRHARRLAKYGVNLARMGGGDFFRLWRRDRAAFRSRLDDYHRRVAALKHEGIYTYIDHLYWHTHHEIDESVYPGFGEGRHAIALIFFSPEFQRLYLDFLRELMTTENPYTGRAMADDPAVAFLEIHNETSLLFYTFDPKKFPSTERKLVEEQFAQWLREKYGSLAAAQRAWGAGLRRGNPTPDDWERGRVGLYSAAMLTGADWARNQRHPQRAADQLQFLVQSQKAFYEQMTRQLRETVGCGQLIVPSNWKTADPRVLDALERYSYTGADVICRNSYFDAEYAEGGQNRFYEIEVGDTYNDRSALKTPGLPAPLGTPQIEGFPFMVTENNWTRPNRYRVEWPLLVASYGSLQGIDGWTFFAKEATDWQHAMGVWDLSNPSVLGQFPAAALMFRRGDVRRPEQPAVREYVSLPSVLQFDGTATVPLRGEDALWRARIGEREKVNDGRDAQVDPLSYFVGPVVQKFGDPPSRVDAVTLEDFVDRRARRVRSLTGELHWDAKLGVVRLDTPRAQGAWGFLADAGPQQCTDIEIESANHYGAVVVVSLDDQPLATSRRILVQTGSWDRPYGFETGPAGGFRRIKKLGGYPLNVREIDARLTLRRTITAARVLDGNGYPTQRQMPVRGSGGRTVIELPTDALYTVIE